MIRKIEMLGDNKTSLTLTKDPKAQNRTKYINIIYYHIRELVKDRELEIKSIASASMLTGGLT